MNNKNAFFLFFLSVILLASCAKPVAYQVPDDGSECPCKDEKELTQKDLLCMNSASKIYSCVNGVELKKEDFYSCEWYLYTGEGTVIRRYDKDEMPMVIRNNIFKAKVLRIRGLRTRDENGKPTDNYFHDNIKLKFKKFKKDVN